MNLAQRNAPRPAVLKGRLPTSSRARGPPTWQISPAFPCEQCGGTRNEEAVSSVHEALGNPQWLFGLVGATIAGSNVREPYGDRPGHQVVSDEEFKALLRDFAKPEIREQIANATYRGPGFVLYDEQGYDRELAKQSVGRGWAALIDRVFDAKRANIFAKLSKEISLIQVNNFLTK